MSYQGLKIEGLMISNVEIRLINIVEWQKHYHIPNIFGRGVQQTCLIFNFQHSINGKDK